MNLSELQANAILERIGVTRDYILKITANIPRSVKANVSKVKSNIYRDKKTYAPIEDCIEFYNQVKESKAFVNTISTNAGLNEYYLRDKIRRKNH